MVDERDFSSRELIRLTGIRSKQVTSLFTQVPLAYTLNKRERAAVRWQLRRDLSRIKWIYEDQVRESDLLPNRTTSEQQREGIANLGDRLLEKMREVPDRSFIRAAAEEHLEVWEAVRGELKTELADLASRERCIQTKFSASKSSSDADIQTRLVQLGMIYRKEKELMNLVQHIDQKRFRLELESGQVSSENLAPEMIVSEIVSDLEILVSLLRTPDSDQKPKATKADAKEWAALELQRLSWKYTHSKSSRESNRNPGPALRFAERASALIVPPDGMPWQTLQFHWRNRKAKRSARRGKSPKK